MTRALAISKRQIQTLLRAAEAERGIPSAPLAVIRSKEPRLPTDLYFVETQCAERFVKIGISADVERRVSKMQMDCPYQIKLLKMVPGAAHMEKELHIRFEAQHVKGEWFRPSAELLAFIDSLEGRTTFRVPEPPTRIDPPMTWKQYHERHDFLA